MNNDVKVTVYGLSTEGYAIACQMAINGADVSIIDESTTSAVHMPVEIARTYPDVSALKEDELILPMEPISVAVSNAQYLFFTPMIRQTGSGIMDEIVYKFKDALDSLTKGNSVIFSLPLSLGGNNEMITLIEHVTGFKVGEEVSYFYYPLNNQSKPPRVIGSSNKQDSVLSNLLSEGKTIKKFATLASSENIHTIKILSKFSNLSAILEICKNVFDKDTQIDMIDGGIGDIFLDDMISGLFDLRMLPLSFEHTDPLMRLINGSLSGVDGYTKHLIDKIRLMLQNRDVKASRVRAVLCWTLDQYAMRGDKIEMRQTMLSRLRDYMGEVILLADFDLDMYHMDKVTLFIACTKSDLETILKIDSNPYTIIVTANPLCEISQ